MEKWYQRVRRYGQTNLTEIDPEVIDLGFWQEFWKKSGTQAIIVNAGGIVAYYPTKLEHHYRAARLGNRDLFGDIVKAGREAGLAIIARMDINRAVESFYRAKPDWFARHKDGSPFITQGRYQSCLTSGYYKEFIPEVLKEIISLYKPDGFTDNSWTGIPRTSICYCINCREGFRSATGAALPEGVNYHDPVYRKWLKWSYQCRLDNWDLFNQVTSEHGGEDCLWMGMISANLIGGHATFTDLREIAKRSKVLMVDSQSRDDTGFEQNSLNGVLLHQLVGWDKVIPESSASYVRGLQPYRRGASSALELHLWMLCGIAGGISPWWHIIGSAQEDTRLFDLHMPILKWHQKHEPYLYNRKPLANIGLLWSQDNVEFGGGLLEKNRVQDSWRGIVMALTRAGLPFLPVNTADMAAQTRDMDLLILPELAVVSKADLQGLEAFLKKGGSILACGEAGVYDPGGEKRSDSSLEALLGLSFAPPSSLTGAGAGWENPILHNYLRIESAENPVFAGFEKTAMLPMGGIYREISVKEGTKVLATYIPPFPIYPPEFVWTNTPKTDKPVITEYTHPKGGRAMYAAWDLDAVYGRAALPDHGDLLANMVLSLLGDKVPFRVTLDGYIDFKVYKQDKRVIIHLVNPNHTGFDQGYAEKTLPVGPLKIKLMLPGFSPTAVTATEDNQNPRLEALEDGSILIHLEKLGLHQLLIVE